MISSLLDQVDAPEIHFKFAMLEEQPIGMGDLLYKFGKLLEYSNNRKLRLNGTLYTDRDRFQHRGFVRNDQLQECETEWILFADCDMVYHPEYFKRLQTEIKTNHATAPYMLIAGRQSNPVVQANKLVEEYDYPCYVEKSWENAHKYLDLHGKRNVGAGYFQLINMKHAPHGGLYVGEDSNRDWAMFDKGCRPKSDIQFRKRIGEKVRLPEWFSQNEIHLNHVRDPDVGHHITEMR